MNNPLILLVGQSGSGKTTIANYLSFINNYNQVQSYTTRAPRYEGETGHIFITEEEFDNLEEVVAYTEYNGNKYGVTAQMLDETDIYVVDIPGVKTLIENYQNKHRTIYVFYFKSTVATRIDRMIERGDCDSAIISRLHTDEQYDWLEKLKNITFFDGKKNDKKVVLRVIDANKPQQEVVEHILWYLPRRNNNDYNVRY